MPTYEYKCGSCGIRFERVQRFDDAPLTECPECHGEVRRLFSPVGIIFKGTGFYSTDHRQLSSGSSSPRKELSAPKDTEKKALTAGESTPTATTDKSDSK
jgi:putative FmdB family regulatory protein